MGSLLLDVFTEDPVCVGDGSVDDHLDPLGVILVRVTVVALSDGVAIVLLHGCGW